MKIHVLYCAACMYVVRAACAGETYKDETEESWSKGEEVSINSYLLLSASNSITYSLKYSVQLKRPRCCC